MPPPFPWDLSNIPACKDGVGRGHKLLLVETWQCRGAWRVASLESNSCIHCGSVKDTLTSLASLLASSLPGTANSSSHQSGILHLSNFHLTHWPKSAVSGSGGVFSSSLSKVPRDPRKKEATIGFSSGSSSKSDPLPWDPSSPDSILGLADQLGASLSANPT